MSFLENVTSALSVFAAKCYDHRSDIEFAAGVVGTVVGTGWLVKKTYDISDDIKGYKTKKDVIKNSTVSDEEKTKALKDLNKSTVGKIVKAYTAPTLVYIAGVVGTGASKVTDKKEIIKTNKALVTATAGYEILKNWIIQNEGEQKYREIAFGEKVKENVDPETGEVTEEVTYEGSVIPGEFAYFFDETSNLYSDVPGANQLVINSCFRHYQLRNTQKGYWLLKDVLEDLGFPKSVYMDERIAKAGNVKKNGVDFGLDEPSIAMKRFKDNLEPVVLLRFNAVPNVYKLL